MKCRARPRTPRLQMIGNVPIVPVEPSRRTGQRVCPVPIRLSPPWRSRFGELLRRLGDCGRLLDLLWHGCGARRKAGIATILSADFMVTLRQRRRLENGYAARESNLTEFRRSVLEQDFASRRSAGRRDGSRESDCLPNL